MKEAPGFRGAAVILRVGHERQIAVKEKAKDQVGGERGGAGEAVNSDGKAQVEQAAAQAWTGGRAGGCQG